MGDEQDSNLSITGKGIVADCEYLSDMMNSFSEKTEIFEKKFIPLKHEQVVYKAEFSKVKKLLGEQMVMLELRRKSLEILARNLSLLEFSIVQLQNEHKVACSLMGMDKLTKGSKLANGLAGFFLGVASVFGVKCISGYLKSRIRE